LALSFCTVCDAEHLPGEHRQSHSTPRPDSHRGGRHLAPKPAPPVKRARITTGLTAFVASCREWGSQAATGLREVIDVSRISSDLATPRRAAEPRHASARTSVGLLERSEGPSIELTMLESLGFYTDSDDLLVTITDPLPPGIDPLLPAASPRSQVPDLEIGGWRPHVIARSKLGRGRLSSLMVVGLCVSLIILVALVASLLQAPAATTARQTSELAATATELAASLSRLDAVISDPAGGVAESSALLLNVDRSARALFDMAAGLPDDNADRQTAIGAAQSALALKTALGDALNYRLVLEPLWQSPELEGVSDSTVAAAQVAEWQVALADVLTDLPASPELGDHVEQVKGFIASVETWRIRYLDALTARNSAAAAAATADLEGQMAILAQSGEDALTAIFVTADAERARLISGLAEL